MMRFTISSILATSLAITPALTQTIKLSLPTNPLTTLSETSIDPSATLGFDYPTLTSDQSETSVTGCPTIHLSTDICSTCMTIQCVVPFTITAGCECVKPVTIYNPHPCAKGCDGLEGSGGCKTSYTVVHPSDCGSSSGGGGGSSTTSRGGESVASSVTTGSASGGSSTESGSIITITSTDTSAASVSTVPPTSSASTAGAGRLTPFRLW